MFYGCTHCVVGASGISVFSAIGVLPVVLETIRGSPMLKWLISAIGLRTGVGHADQEIIGVHIGFDEDGQAILGIHRFGLCWSSGRK